MLEFLEALNRVVWGAPTVALILGTGCYLTVRAGFPQVRLFPHALAQLVRGIREKPTQEGAVSPFQALCTALAATVGTGNIAGVAGAIAVGGPGAIFWMWLCGLVGMATKSAEAVLAVRFREKNARGEYVGGPMYLIQTALKGRGKTLAACYCFFGVLAAFGVGNGTQVNAVICGVNTYLSGMGVEQSLSRNLGMGLLLAAAITAVLSGGGKRIGQAAEGLVPFAAAGYVLLCLAAIGKNLEAVPLEMKTIVTGAFSPQAVTGGMVGSAFQAVRVGVSRGVFTNEAGMGTASIAHAQADTDHPVKQGLLGMVEVFIDTIFICTMTALVILTSGISIPYGVDEGAGLTIRAFSACLGPWVSLPITGFLCCFAVATVLGWGLYGGRCAQYLFGNRAWGGFVLLQGLGVAVSSLISTGTVWLLSETVNGLMAVPNLLALCLLGREYCRLTAGYCRELKGHPAKKSFRFPRRWHTQAGEERWTVPKCPARGKGKRKEVR